jgi:hypothetical protein
VILETVRIVSDWLGDPTFGVNTLRSAVPRDTGVSVPPAVSVLDSTRDARIARGSIPTGIGLPAVLVTPNDSPLESAVPTVRPWPPDATITVLIRLAMSNEDTAAAERDASQLLRAIWRSIGHLMTTTQGMTARARAGVQLISVRSLQAATLYESDKDTVVTGGVLATCHVRDTWAQQT